MLLLAHAVPADEGSVGPEGEVDPWAHIERAYQDDLKRYAGNANVLVLPGLVADRSRHRVIAQGAATGIGGDEPVEFLLVARNSAHDYEALAIVYANPSDLHRALEFIGMQKGSPVDEKKRRFWPKGERVLVTVTPSSSGAYASRLEAFVLDRRTGQTMSEAGLVFCGSFDTPLVGSDSGEKVYYADTYDPNSIASTYNEPTTVLDVPRQASQNGVYGDYTAHPARPLQPGEQIEIRFEPEHTDGTRRVVELSLRVSAGGDAAPAFVLSGRTNSAPLAEGTITDVLRTLSEMPGQGHDPFLDLTFAPDVTLGAARNVAQLLGTIETENGIRMDPPPAGQLYYRALLPSPSFRDREKRLSQPWELHLRIIDGAVAATLVHIKETWTDEKLEPDLEPSEYAVRDPAQLRAQMDQTGGGLPVILVYADPDIRHGRLMEFLEPVLETHPIVYVFVEDAAEQKSEPTPDRTSGSAL